jgi:hypothetical protein
VRKRLRGLEGSSTDTHGRVIACSFEEYTDYIFPDETGMAPNLKILEAAYKWKRQKTGSDDEA